jgi:hypothetical protein
MLPPNFMLMASPTSAVSPEILPEFTTVPISPRPTPNPPTLPVLVMLSSLYSDMFSE